MLALTLLFYLFLAHDYKKLSNNQQSLSTEILSRKLGFLIPKNDDELNSLIFHHTKTYETIRVSGTGRQNILDKSHSGYKSIRKYYDRILSRLKTTHDTGCPEIEYKRILPRELQTEFRKHIEDSLNQGQINKHKVV